MTLPLPLDFVGYMPPLSHLNPFISQDTGPCSQFQTPFLHYLPSFHTYGIYFLLVFLCGSHSRWFGLADVGFKEELDKEHKVAEVHEGGPNNVLHVGWTLLALLHPRVHQVVDYAAHQHLCDLGQCDEHGKLAWQLETSCTQCVVRVHDSMDQVVHGHEPPAASHHVLVGVPGVEQHSNVVVPVEKDELLFPQDNEQSVTCE